MGPRQEETPKSSSPLCQDTEELRTRSSPGSPTPAPPPRTSRLRAVRSPHYCVSPPVCAAAGGTESLRPQGQVVQLSEPPTTPSPRRPPRVPHCWAWPRGFLPGDPGKPLLPGRPCNPLMPRSPGRPVGEPQG